MLIIVDEIEYEVPYKIGVLVNRYKAYEVASGGFSPGELADFITDTAKTTREILSSLREIEKKFE